MPEVTWVRLPPVGFGLPPGGRTHTSCGNTAVSEGKLHVIWSPLFRLAVAGCHLSPEASTLTVLAAGPAGLGSVAENFTVTGAEYVRSGPGVAGWSVPVVTGASLS